MIRDYILLFIIKNIMEIISIQCNKEVSISNNTHNCFKTPNKYNII